MSFHSWLQNFRNTLTPRRGHRRHTSCASLRATTLGSGIEALEVRTLLTFSPAANFAVNLDPQDMVAGDFNNDGQIDLATANTFGDVNVLLGDGLGGFGAPIGPNTGSEGWLSQVSLSAADFNQDGKLDLAMSVSSLDPENWGLGWINVVLGNGDGTFRESPTPPVSYFKPVSLAVGDFNRDGNNDLVISEDDLNSFGYVEVLSGNGQGGFTQSMAYSTSHPSLGVAIGYGGDTYWLVDSYTRQQMAVGDFSGEGTPDLLVAGNGGVGIQLGLDDGTIDQAHTNYFVGPGGYPVFVAAADFNGDNILDALTCDGDTATVSVLPGLGYGLLLGSSGTFSVSAHPQARAIDDFNNDGRPDVAVASGGSNTVSILLNDGNWPVDDTPGLRIDDVSVVEGNTGTVNAVFTVTRFGPSTGTVTVAYATADGSATAGSDYQSASGTLTFAPGETTKTITVVVNGDRLGEWNDPINGLYETFSVALSNPTNATILDSQGVGTIVEDEPRVAITPYVSQSEGNSGKTPVTLAVTLSSASDVAVTMDWATADSIAYAGSDYQAANGTLTFAPGQTSKSITVFVYGDRIAEQNEYFFVNLTNANHAFIQGFQCTVGIANDEPRISISDVTKSEGKKNQKTQFTFTVTLSAAYDQAVTMSFKTADGTAKVSDSDYVAQTGSLTFAPGQTTKTITIQVNGDSKKETNETFYLDLSGLSRNALFTKNRGIGTILNDD